MHIAVLVVYAKQNQFCSLIHKGQIKEHMLLCKGSGINRLKVVINRVDLVD